MILAYYYYWQEIIPGIYADNLFQCSPCTDNCLICPQNF